jgi:hypothetical protein
MFKVNSSKTSYHSSEFPTSLSKSKKRKSYDLFPSSPKIINSQKEIKTRLNCKIPQHNPEEIKKSWCEINKNINSEKEDSRIDTTCLQKKTPQEIYSKNVMNLQLIGLEVSNLNSRDGILYVDIIKVEATKGKIYIHCLRQEDLSKQEWKFSYKSEIKDAYTQHVFKMEK